MHVAFSQRGIFSTLPLYHTRNLYDAPCKIITLTWQFLSLPKPCSVASHVINIKDEVPAGFIKVMFGMLRDRVREREKLSQRGIGFEYFIALVIIITSRRIFSFEILIHNDKTANMNLRESFILQL